jgi:cytochrome c peroxidase
MKIALAVAVVLVASSLRAEVWVLPPPLGLDLHMPVPSGNPLTPGKVALGRQLFFDKRLSRDRSLACASCHDPKRAFADGRVLPRGVDGVQGVRHAPALINRGYGASFFWDGRSATLERQVLEPIFNSSELGLTPAELERRLELSPAAVADALASYVRTIRSGNSAFDRYAAGNMAALDEPAKRGLTLFRGKAGCVTCHPAPNFTDEEFHNTGIAWRGDHFADDGRAAVSGNARDRGAFKTPTLRESGRTAPYMHDGSLATLSDVVRFYSNGGGPNPNLDARIRRRDLTQTEQNALVAFLQALTGHVREGS